MGNEPSSRKNQKADNEVRTQASAVAEAPAREQTSKPAEVTPAEEKTAAAQKSPDKTQNASAVRADRGDEEKKEVATHREAAATKQKKEPETKVVGVQAAAEEPAGGEGIQQVDLAAALESIVVKRLLDLFTTAKEWDSESNKLSLKVKHLGEEGRKNLNAVANMIGFASVELAQDFLVLEKPEGSEESRQAKAEAKLEAQEGMLPGFLPKLDKEVEEQVMACLRDAVEEFVASKSPKQTIDAKFMLPPGQVQERLHQLAKQKGLGASGWSLLGHGTEIPLATASKGGEGGEGGPDAKLSPRVIPEGELVWRRLQHWCTNVRKEKKFNIWARNLDSAIKQKIIDVALEVGFEAATVQPNGNIHVEIKPPADKQNRKRLRRPSPEVVEELIPVDKAVTENATAHMQEWITEFAKSKKPRDTLNCRFALPADWIRKTATELAESNLLKVVQETGIELIFSRTDLTEEQIEDMLKKSKEEPKVPVQIGRSPRDSRVSPRMQNPRLSPRTQNGHSRGGRGSRGRSDGRIRTPRTRSEFRSRTPPPNFSQHHSRHMSGGGLIGSMNSMPMRGIHPTGGMPPPNWQARNASFHSSPYANAGVFPEPGSLFDASHSYGGAGSMPVAPFGGGHYSAQHHHANRGGSHSSRMYREDGYGKF